MYCNFFEKILLLNNKGTVMKYEKAPVSEVILGIMFSSNKISVDALFKISTVFAEEFPIVEILPPLILEELNDFIMQPITSDLNAGPFLIRRRSKDNKWLIQMQSNKIYLNWIREDDEPVGSYVGFSEIKKRFDAILANISAITDIKSGHRLYELSYHDRFEWEQYIKGHL